MLSFKKCALTIEGKIPILNSYMYKLILVDDEKIVREWIRDNINWQENGFLFSGDCEDGTQALELIELIQPDVVLTDICMPFLDGLELASYVRQCFPRVKVILLTGYDNFEYAQEAVKLNVYDYILKPVTIKDLKKILHRVKRELDLERAATRKFEELKEKLAESLPLLRERFLNKMVRRKVKHNEIVNRLSYLGIQFSYSYFSILVISIDHASEIIQKTEEEKFELLIIAISNICSNLLRQAGIKGEILNDNDENIVIIFNSQNKKVLEKQKIEIAENIRQLVEQRLNNTVTIGIGTVVKSLSQLPVSYSKAVASLDYRFQLGTNQIIHYKDVMPEKTTMSITNKDWLQEIYLSLKFNNKVETNRLIKEMIKTMKAELIPMPKSIVFFQKIIASIYNILDELSIKESIVFVNIDNPFLYLASLKTLEKIEEWLIEICNIINHLMSIRRDSINRKKIEDAKSYILRNYNSDNMNLNSICNYLAVSTSKFGQILKKYTNQTFIEYLTRIRIQKAMGLLKTTDLKIYEVASETGFNDPHYFSFIFRKINSMSPNQYRKKFEEPVYEKEKI